MNWLIVEDALRNRQGHWFEYMQTFVHGLATLGDRATVLADRCAEIFIINSLKVKPILPESIWHRLETGGPVRRMIRIPLHAWRTYRTVKHYLKRAEPFDVILVPTVLPHHLLGWFWLINGPLRRSRTRVILYFLSIPVIIDSQTKNPRILSSPSSQLLKWLLKSLHQQVKRGKLVLGVETEAMCEAMTTVTGTRFTYLPQPVDLLASRSLSSSNGMTMACYGGARYEKGSDILQLAIKLFLQKHPHSQVRFIIQWITDFHDLSGKSVTKDSVLMADSRVEYITHYFEEGEYLKNLASTDAMLLPYRKSSYGLRGSRVVIEAMINGIPVVATEGTTLNSDASRFGAVITCEDESVESLCNALEQMEQNYPALHAHALQQMAHARTHFSLNNYRNKAMSISR